MSEDACDQMVAIDVYYRVQRILSIMRLLDNLLTGKDDRTIAHTQKGSGEKFR